MSAPDVFLSHASADKPLVRRIASRLVMAGVEPWLDEWNLIPGAPWQPAIESALATCKSVAVFVGPAGIAPWHHQEMRSAIARRVSDQGFRVIPVLLPGGRQGKQGQFPPFLVDATWVDFANLDDEEPLRLLICGIRGVAPGPRAQSSPQPASPVGRGHVHPGRIIVLSQDAGFLGIAGQHLAAAGHEFRLVGEVERLPFDVQLFRPDLVVAHSMGRWGWQSLGEQALHELARREETRAIPVAFALPVLRVGELVSTFCRGAVDVLYGPFTTEHILRIEALLDDLAGQGQIQPSERLTNAFLAFARRSRLDATLFVNRSVRGQGRASFVDGRLAGASHGAAAGIEAVRSILQSAQGAFELEMRSKGHVSQVPGASTANEPIRPRVLVVDDEEDMISLLAKHISRAGFDVATACDGAQGYEAAVTAAFTSPYDVVVADLSMPVMDGWEMIGRLKSDRRTREAQVIVLSAYDNYRESLRASGAGAYDYLAKTGRSNIIVPSITSAVAPRLGVIGNLVARRSVQIDAEKVGILWLVLTLERLKSSGVLELQDGWGRYRLTVADGIPTAAVAEVKRREVDDRAAVEALLAAKSPAGSFVPSESQPDDASGLAPTMRELVESICRQELDAMGTSEPLPESMGYEVNARLYDLYCRVASRRKVAIAKAICEQNASLAEATRLGEAVKMPASWVVDLFGELLLRGVITPREQ